MLYLSSANGKRNFKVFDQNWHFLLGVLAYDMHTNCTRLLTTNETMLNAYQCCDVANKINKALTNNVIYEVWDGVKVEPLMNPNTEILSNLGSTVQPLTEKRKTFMVNLSDFIRSHDELYLNIK